MPHGGARFLPLVLAALLLAMPHAARAENEYMGVLYPVRHLTLSLGVGGVVSSMDVRIGARVQAGQQLLKLDAGIQETEVQRRRAIRDDDSGLKAERQRLEILERLYEDAETLFTGVGSISGQEVSQLRIEYVTAAGRVEQLESEKRRHELEYEMARRERDQRILLAPIDGVITELDLDVGEWTDPGDHAMRLVDASTVVLRVSVSAGAAYRMEQGMEIPVHVVGLPGGEPRTGEVTFVSPVADAASGLVEVRITLENDDLSIRPGTRASIVLENRS